MRVVFFGTPDFAVTSLKKLVDNGVNMVAAVTAPDKPSGRGLQMQVSPVKQFCVERGITILQPTNLKDPSFISVLKEMQADLNIVVAFRMLPELVWNMPPLGTYNLHASLLPKYRGAAPINWSIINGEKETGVTTFKLQQQIDTGNILYFEKVKISDTMNAGQLHDTLMQVGAELLLKTVQSIEQAQINKSELKFIEQNETEVCHAPKIFKTHCLIDWNKPALQVYNMIRGLSPYPGAFTNIIKGSNKPQQLKIYTSKFYLSNHTNTNGSLLTDNATYLHVSCSEGFIELQEVQLEGKKRMQINDFLKGYKIEEGTRFSE